MTSSCSNRPSRRVRRGRILSLALIFLSGFALTLTSVVGTRAQNSTADISASKGGDETARVGGQITYTIAAYNAGPDTATNVVLTDVIPAYTTYVSATVTAGSGSASFDGTTLTVTFDSIPQFESGVAMLVVMVNDNAPRGTVITNTVTATASSSDPQSFNNTASTTTVVTGPFAGDLLISEFRLRGPAGATDEYIEVFNNTGGPHSVQTTDDSTGYTVVASDGIVRCTIPNGTIIPARGHVLCVNEVGYSLALYPGGETSTATGDFSYTTDIPDNAGLALFRTSNSNNFNLVNRLDAVGSTAVTDALYREGTGYPALSQVGLDYAIYRDLCGKAGSISTFGPCPTAGAVKDTDNNAVDFVFVEPNGNSSGAESRLGAPGPENLAGPVQSNNSFAVTLLDPCVGSATPPNRVRSFTSDPANNSTFGTLEIRRTVTNGTGQNVTRLRWRIIDITTFPAPAGISDLRARTSTPVVVTVDRPPCGSGMSNVTVQGTTLETPPTQPNGGAFNSSLSSGTITLSTPLADAESIDLRFLLGIQQTGSFKFFINIEALTREPEVVPEAAPRPTSVRPRKGARAMPANTVKSAPPARPSVGAPTSKANKIGRQ